MVMLLGWWGLLLYTDWIMLMLMFIFWWLWILCMYEPGLVVVWIRNYWLMLTIGIKLVYVKCGLIVCEWYVKWFLFCKVGAHMMKWGKAWSRCFNKASKGVVKISMTSSLKKFWSTWMLKNGKTLWIYKKRIRVIGLDSWLWSNGWLKSQQLSKVNYRSKLYMFSVILNFCVMICNVIGYMEM